MGRLSGRASAMLLGWLVLAPAIACAQDMNAAERRAQAELQAARADAAGDGAALSAALSELLATGATLAPDDPWDAMHYLSRLDALNMAAGGAFDRQIRVLRAQARGSSGGFSRFDLELAPGAREAFALTVVGGEAAIVEARLKRGSGTADVDLVVTGPGGAEQGADRGPETGIVGRAAYVEFLPARCLEVTALLVNEGSETARLAVISPPALEPRCDP